MKVVGKELVGYSLQLEFSPTMEEISRRLMAAGGGSQCMTEGEHVPSQYRNETTSPRSASPRQSSTLLYKTSINTPRSFQGVQTPASIGQEHSPAPETQYERSLNVSNS